jgi:antitoxin ParD1/3/4
MIGTPHRNGSSRPCWRQRQMVDGAVHRRSTRGNHLAMGVSRDELARRLADADRRLVLCARPALRALAIIANSGRVRYGRRRVPTRNINLTAEQNEFVEKIVASGEYQNASEMIRDALRVLQRVRREDALKLKFLRTQVKAGTDALERGEFVEVHDADLDAYLDELGTPSLTRAR